MGLVSQTVPRDTSPGSTCPGRHCQLPAQVLLAPSRSPCKGGPVSFSEVPDPWLQGRRKRLGSASALASLPRQVGGISGEAPSLHPLHMPPETTSRLWVCSTSRTLFPASPHVTSRLACTRVCPLTCRLSAGGFFQQLPPPWAPFSPRTDPLGTEPLRGRGANCPPVCPLALERAGGRDTAVPQSEDHQPRPSQLLRLQREEEAKPVPALHLPACQW